MELLDQCVGYELVPSQALVGLDVVHQVGPVDLVGLVVQPPHPPWTLVVAVVWEPPQDQAGLLF